MQLLGLQLCSVCYGPLLLACCRGAGWSARQQCTSPSLPAPRPAATTNHRSPTTASLPCLQAIIAGLRESVQTFQSEVSDVNSRDVMELLLITQASSASWLLLSGGVGMGGMPWHDVMGGCSSRRHVV